MVREGEGNGYGSLTASVKRGEWLRTVTYTWNKPVGDMAARQ